MTDTLEQVILYMEKKGFTKEMRMQVLLTFLPEFLTENGKKIVALMVWVRQQTLEEYHGT